MPKILQKGICSVLVVALSLACSVQAFAAGFFPSYVDISNLLSGSLGFRFLKPVSGSDGVYSLDVQVSNLPVSQQSLWTECMEKVASDDYVMCLLNWGRGALLFYFFPRDLIPTPSGNLNPSEPGYFYFGSERLFTVGARSFGFVASGDKLVCSSASSCSRWSFGSTTPANGGVFCTDSSFVLEKATGGFSFDFSFIEGIDALQITDDLGNSSVKPEPEPGPAPEPDPRPPYVPEMPTIPAGNSEYVPYDTSIWWTFIEHIGRNAGGSSTMGMYILFAIIAIPFALRVIKKFFHI